MARFKAGDKIISLRAKNLYEVYSVKNEYYVLSKLKNDSQITISISFIDTWSVLAEVFESPLYKVLYENT